MVKNRKAILFCLLGVWALISCTITPKPIIVASPVSVSTTKNELISITPQVTLALPSVESTETKAIVQSTPEIAPTRSTISNNPNQVTDGNLKLSIKEADNRCYQMGNRISLILTYENLTDNPLTIMDYNLISTHTLSRSQGQLYPVLTTKQNARLFSREDSMFTEPLNPNPPLIQSLPAKGKFDVSVEYGLSMEYITDRQQDNQFQPLPPGQYYLKLVYTAIGYEGSWEGIISSNQIEICIGN